MLANGAVSDFVSGSRLGVVEVRTPDPDLLRTALERLGAAVSGSGEDLAVTGVTAEQVGDAAHAANARIHQLVTTRATLEEAFLEATGLDEEFRGSEVGDPS